MCLIGVFFAEIQLYEDHSSGSTSSGMRILQWKRLHTTTRKNATRVGYLRSRRIACRGAYFSLLSMWLPQQRAKDDRSHGIALSVSYSENTRVLRTQPSPVECVNQFLFILLIFADHTVACPSLTTRPTASVSSSSHPRSSVYTFGRARTSW